MARVSMPHGGFAKTNTPNSIFEAPKTKAEAKAKAKKQVCKRPAARLQEQEAQEDEEEEEDEEQQVSKRPAAGLPQEDEEAEEEEEDQVNDDHDDDEDDAHDDEAGPDWSHLDKNTLSELEGGWPSVRSDLQNARFKSQGQKPFESLLSFLLFKNF